MPHMLVGFSTQAGDVDYLFLPLGIVPSDSFQWPLPGLRHFSYSVCWSVLVGDLKGILCRSPELSLPVQLPPP